MSVVSSLSHPGEGAHKRGRGRQHWVHWDGTDGESAFTSHVRSKNIILQRSDEEKKKKSNPAAAGDRKPGNQSPTASVHQLFRARAGMRLIAHVNPMKSMWCAIHVCLSTIVSSSQMQTPRGQTEPGSGSKINTRTSHRTASRSISCRVYNKAQSWRHNSRILNTLRWFSLKNNTLIRNKHGWRANVAAKYL